MIKIRLTRLGKKNQPAYRIVVVDERKKRDGQYLSSLGYYQPLQQPPLLKLDAPAYLAG